MYVTSNACTAANQQLLARQCPKGTVGTLTLQLAQVLACLPSIRCLYVCGMHEAGHWYPLTLMATPCASTSRGPGHGNMGAVTSSNATSATHGAGLCAMDVRLCLSAC
jgi:hypothetical protein